MSVSVCLCVSVCVHSKTEAPAACYSKEHSPQGGVRADRQGCGKASQASLYLCWALIRRGTSVCRNRGEGIFGERNKYLRKGRDRGWYKACAMC